eukprot:GEMP01099194.1.p1 GENE.GEMP01099194.1~~GEMP01099194.1.p1  ORF type:complete len:123 (-),score=7.03 GEMP01099194.1:282-650(-)
MPYPQLLYEIQNRAYHFKQLSFLISIRNKKKMNRLQKNIIIAKGIYMGSEQGSEVFLTNSARIERNICNVATHTLTDDDTSPVEALDARFRLKCPKTILKNIYIEWDVDWRPILAPPRLIQS